MIAVVDEMSHREASSARAWAKASDSGFDLGIMRQYVVCQKLLKMLTLIKQNERAVRRALDNGEGPES